MGIRITIDPGHGGSETGAISNGYTEKHLNLEVALLLEKELDRCGFEVILTRRTDIKLTLSARGLTAKRNGCRLMFSIHFNSYNGDAKGSETIYSFFKECTESSKYIAQCVLDETVKLGTVKRRVFTYESGVYPGRNYYGVLRHSEPMPAVLAEGLFIDNEDDARLLEDPDFLKKLAIAYAKGICKAHGVRYAPYISPFGDHDDISDYAKSSVKAIREAGLMTGDDQGNFNPKDPLSRQDFAVVTMKALKYK